MRLRAEALNYAVGRRILVSDVSLDLAPGQKLAVLGPNGSGKSTLLRLLAGLLRPRSGAVTYGAQPARGMRRRDLARSLAFVEQQAVTADDLSLRDVVALGRIPWLGAFSAPGPEDERAVAEAMARMNLSDLAQARWRHLSGGERQRAQIARALAQEPQILLLDEPGNHLDIRHQLEVMRLIAELPLTVVMSLHDLNQAMGCDQAMLLDNGRAVSTGVPSDVLTPASIAAVFGVVARPPPDAEGEIYWRFHL